MLHNYPLSLVDLKQPPFYGFSRLGIQPEFWLDDPCGIDWHHLIGSADEPLWKVHDEFTPLVFWLCWYELEVWAQSTITWSRKSGALKVVGLFTWCLASPGSGIPGQSSMDFSDLVWKSHMIISLAFTYLQLSHKTSPNLRRRGSDSTSW